MKTTLRVLAVCLMVLAAASLCYAAADQPSCLAKQLDARASLLTPAAPATLLPTPQMTPVAAISQIAPRIILGRCITDCSVCIQGQIPDYCEVRNKGTFCYPECP